MEILSSCLAMKATKLQYFHTLVSSWLVSHISKVLTSGTGGVGAVVGHLQDDQAQYAYVKVEVTNEETTRTKFVLISWVGENTSPLKKGKVSVDKYALSFITKLALYIFILTMFNRPGLKGVIKDLTLEIATSDRDDLTDEKVIEKIRKANY